MATAKQKAAPPKSIKAAARKVTTKPPPKAAPVTARAPAAKATPVKAPVKVPTKAAKASKPKKPKLVRDSFTIPKAEYEALAALKQRALKLAQPVKKSELLRAGIKALSGQSDAAFLSSLKAVPAIKTGRPKLAAG